MSASSVPSRTKIILAFAFLYLVWGSTYLGIRLCVREMPPFLFAGSRNLTAGCLTLLGAFLWSAPRPNFRQTLDASVMGVFLFLGGNGGVAWGEQVIPTGVAALLVGTTPFWMVFLHKILHKGPPLRVSTWVGLTAGFAGVAVLANPFAGSAGERLDLLGCVVVLLSAVSWSIGSVWGRGRDLPSSPFVSSGIQMAAGGLALLLLSGATGEWGRFHVSSITSTGVWAFTYLIVFGSIMGFSAFYYLLRRTPPHVVSSYAYVNPVVAVLLGSFFLGETLGWRTFLATGLIVGGVVLMTWLEHAAPAPD